MKIPKCKNVSLQLIRREVNLAWLAGIIDGEGNISYSMKPVKGTKYLSPKIRVSNTDMRMIQKMAQIYCEENIVFFYSLGKRKIYNPKWKDQLSIEIASQGSVKKLLALISPYLCNKKRAAEILVSAIDYVQSLPRCGNTTRNDYAKHDKFKEILCEWETEKQFYIDPSTTTRRARTVCSW